jgi:hypothetical protein
MILEMGKSLHSFNPSQPFLENLNHLKASNLGANIRDDIWRSEMKEACPEISVIQQGIMAVGVEQPGDGPVVA